MSLLLYSSHVVAQKEKMQQACVIIQRAWRRFRTTYTLFVTLVAELEPARLANLEMAAYSAHFTKPHIVTDAKLLFTRLHAILYRLSGRSVPNPICSVGTLLYAFTIDGRPLCLVDDKHAQRSNLLYAAKQMVEGFYDIWAKLLPSSKKWSDAIPSDDAATQLSAVNMFVETRSVYMTGCRQRMLLRARTSITRLSELVGDLIESGKDLDKVPTYLAAIQDVKTQYVKMQNTEAVMALEDEIVIRLRAKAVARKMYPWKLTLFSAEDMAHELLLNPTFQFQESDYGHPYEPFTFRCEREKSQTLFWKRMTEEVLLEIPSFAYVLVLLESLRQYIGEWKAGMEEPMPASEILNMDVLQAHIYAHNQEQEEWSYLHMAVQRLYDFFREMMHPTRRAVMAMEWASIPDLLANARGLVLSLRFLDRCAHLHDVDTRNLRIRFLGISVAKPTTNDAKLPRTRRWLLPHHTTSLLSTHTHALVAVVNSSFVDECPETLLRDHHQLAFLCSEFVVLREICVVATVLSVSPMVWDYVIYQLDAAVTVEDVQAVDMPYEWKHKLKDAGDALRALFSKRISEYLYAQRALKKDKKLISIPHVTFSPKLQRRMAGFKELFCKVAELNLEVYEHAYLQLLTPTCQLTI